MRDMIIQEEEGVYVFFSAFQCLILHHGKGVCVYVRFCMCLCVLDPLYFLKLKGCVLFPLADPPPARVGSQQGVCVCVRVCV